jgi:hypothetical protein
MQVMKHSDNSGIGSRDKTVDLKSNEPQGRRQALAALTTLAAAGLAATPANAFDKTFPDELNEMDPLESKIVMGTRLNSQQRTSKAVANAKVRQQNVINFNLQNDLLPSSVWGLSLWFLSGSRSNPLSTPLANLLYDENKEQWLKDRNADLFAAPPLPFLVFLGFVFVCLGGITQFALLQISEGDTDGCLQLAGVALIGGGALELGRIANGDKEASREEFDRDEQLKQEFDEFAKKRLMPGGNCHRSDVVSAFRRFYAKYRQRDSEQYPLSDLEIERLLRAWNNFENRGRAERSSVGFYKGLQINKDADVFV